MQIDKERTRKIEDLLVKYRLSEGFPPLKPNELRVMAGAWSEHLRVVSTYWLDQCYLRAYKTRDPDKPFSAGLILKQWLEAVQSGEVAASRVPPGSNEIEAVKREECPYECSHDGFYTVDHDGNPPHSDFTGYTYARPCPIHRPKGIPTDKRCAPHSKPPWIAKEGEKEPTWPRP